MYCIIDIETTGGSKRYGKVTEVAIYKHDGHKVVDSYVSLVNPECDIPYQITNLTGISNEMVASAPKFYEIAKNIIDITEDSVFVAHNVNFDYGFIQKEFAELGYEYNRKTLCTVRESRRWLPGMHSYSLGKLCFQLGIELNNRHRAAGDAQATVLLFEKLLEKSPDLGIKRIARSKEALAKALHPSLDVEAVYALPQKTGVYYFRNESNDIIYVGKSKNIRKRVITHLRQTKSERAMRMQQEAVSIDYELTGSELVALIVESNEIKAYKPKYNRAQRKDIFPYGIYAHYDLFGYLHFSCEKSNQTTAALAIFTSMQGAKNRLYRLCEEFGLCYGLCGVGDCGKNCFHQSVKMCDGAMQGKEPPLSYNVRAEEALAHLQYENEDALLIDRGRDGDEMACILIRNGHFRGIGYCDRSFISRIEDAIDSVKPMKETKDIKNLIRHFMREKKVERIVSLS